MADLVNPYEDLTDPNQLTDPQKEFWDRAEQGFSLSPGETAHVDELIKRTRPSVESVAIAIGGAYLVYRRFMARKLAEELPKTGSDPKTLELVAAVLFRSFLPSWSAVVVPALMKGYLTGMREAKLHAVSDQYLYDIAQKYSDDLGNHMNEVSMDAMMRGYNAQINRKVPAARAVQQVASAYGVPPRTMNALISVWNSEDKKKLTAVPTEVARDLRAKAMTEKAALLRARQMGDHESWVAKSQAKQIVWMYGVNTGTLPRNSRRVWVTADDEKVCQICGPMHELSAPVDVKFKTSNGDYWCPPTHVNCRCDVILDVDITPEMDAELQEMVESTPVHKSRFADPFDRDTHGRFSRVEQRPARQIAFKQVEPIKLQDLWEQAKTREQQETLTKIMDDARARYAARKSAPTALRRESLSGLHGEALGGTALRGQALGAKPQEEVEALQPVSLRPDRAKQEALRQLPIGAQLERKLKISNISAIKADMPERLQRPIDTGSGDNWQVLDEPMFTLLDKSEIGEGDQVRSFTTDINTNFAMGEEGLRKLIFDHWSEVETELLDAMAETEIKVKYTDAQGQENVYDVGMADLDTVIASAISGEHPDNAATVWISSGEGADYHEVPMNAHALGYKIIVPGTEMNLHEYVMSQEPVVAVINHGFPGQFEINNTKYGLDIQNFGKWVLGAKFEEGGAAHDRPYSMHYAEPIDLA